MGSIKRPNTRSYVEGNAVRKEWATPDYGEEVPARRRPLTEEEFREKKKKEESSRARVARRRKNQTAGNLDFVSILYLSAAIIITMYVCVGYLSVQSNITSMSKKAISLENDLIRLQNENDAQLQRVNASIDLEHIYKVATKELKMVHANKEQIISYEGAKKDYVRKYGEIPEVKDKTIVDKILNKK